MLPVHTCRHTKSHTGAVSYYRRVTYGMGQLDGTVSRCIGWDGMGWDGPNEAGAATFQATSTGQRRAPPRGNQCCGSGPVLGSWQVSLIKGAGFWTVRVWQKTILFPFIWTPSLNKKLSSQLILNSWKFHCTAKTSIGSSPWVQPA